MLVGLRGDAILAMGLDGSRDRERRWCGRAWTPKAPSTTGCGEDGDGGANAVEGDAAVLVERSVELA